MKRTHNHQARIEAIDVLRGIALLGILLVNIQNFSMPSITQFNPTAYGQQGLSNNLIHALTYVLAEQKFMAIFSMLFGAGVLSLSHRPRHFHFRRMSWLLVFGLFHMFLIWSGDVLVVYAICGSVVYGFRQMRPRRQFVLGLIIFLTPVGLNVYVGANLSKLEPSRHAQLHAIWQPSEHRLADELNVYRGTYSAQVRRRLRLTRSPQESDALMDSTQDERESRKVTPLALFASWLTPIVGSVARALGMMLVGMALFTEHVLHATRTPRLYRWTAIVGLGIGIPLSAYGYYQNVLHNWTFNHAMFVGRNAQIVATVFTSLGYVGCTMLWAQSNGCARARRQLAAVGRMSLTNYIVQSVLATMIFYGFGFGLFGVLSRREQLTAVLGIWGLQIGYSQWWLHRYQYGPLERVWRDLTCWPVARNRS